MVIANSGGGSSGGGGGLGGFPNDTSFVIAGGGSFHPYYQPERLRVKKARTLDRKENFCGGEDVSDNGSKNREIHINGIMLERNINAFNSVVDSNQPMDLITKGWSGEVRCDQGEVEGPVGWDPIELEYQWDYTFDFVSTGVDEPQKPPDYGIL